MALFVLPTEVQYPSTFKMLVQNITDKGGNLLPVATTKYKFRLYIKGDPDYDYEVSFDGTTRVNSHYDATRRQLFILFQNYDFRREGVLICEDQSEIMDPLFDKGKSVLFSSNMTGVTFRKFVLGCSSLFEGPKTITAVITATAAPSTIGITGNDVEKSEFTGIKQSTRSAFNAMPADERKGFLWFVREPTPVTGKLRPQLVNMGVDSPNYQGTKLSFVGKYEVLLHGSEIGKDIEFTVSENYKLKYQWNNEKNAHLLYFSTDKGWHQVFAFLPYTGVTGFSSGRYNFLGYFDALNGEQTSVMDITDDLLESISVHTSYYPTSVYLGNMLYSNDPNVNHLFIQRELMKVQNIFHNPTLSSNGKVGVSMSYRLNVYDLYDGRSNNYRMALSSMLYRDTIYNGVRDSGYSVWNALLNLYYSKPPTAVNQALVNLQNWSLRNLGADLPSDFFEDVYALSSPSSRLSSYRGTSLWLQPSDMLVSLYRLEDSFRFNSGGLYETVYEMYRARWSSGNYALVELNNWARRERGGDVPSDLFYKTYGMWAPMDRVLSHKGSGDWNSNSEMFVSLYQLEGFFRAKNSASGLFAEFITLYNKVWNV